MEFISREPQSKRDKTVDVLRIRELVRALTGDPEQAIMVSELACLEEDCPPIETVISMLDGDRKTYKIHKPLKDVTPLDIEQVIANEIEGHEHQ
jgi:hypothetical protein